MGIKIEAEAKVNGKAEGRVCCDCPDGGCYTECSAQCLRVLSDLDAALADAYFHPAPQSSGKKNSLHLSFKATCGKTGAVLAHTESKSDGCSDDFLTEAKQAFECCRNHAAVKKCLVP